MPNQKEDDVSEDEDEEMQALKDTSMLVERCLNESLKVITEEEYSRPSTSLVNLDTSASLPRQ